jgi:hypothetical protein
MAVSLHQAQTPFGTQAATTNATPDGQRCEDVVATVVDMQSQRSPVLTETNRMHLVPFGMQSRTFGLYLAASNRLLISLLCGVVPPQVRGIRAKQDMPGPIRHKQ